MKTSSVRCLLPYGFLLTLAAAWFASIPPAFAEPTGQAAKVRELIGMLDQELFARQKNYSAATDDDLLKVLDEMERVVWGYADSSKDIETRRFRLHVCLYKNAQVPPPPKP